MTSTAAGNSGDDYRKVMQSVRDYIFENHRFPQVNDVVDATSIQKLRCNEVVDELVAQKRLYVAFEGEGLPKIVLLYDMMQGVLMTQKKPDWLKNYGFKEKEEIESKMTELRKTAIQYDQFERLLYGANIPLEEAIAHSLEWLGFEDVVHHRDDPNNSDVTFRNSAIKALVEVEGTNKAGDKRKVNQLNGWLTKEIDNGATRNSLRGFFAVNHYRDLEPSSRADPLTPHAKEYLRHFDGKFFTTVFLYNNIRDTLADKRSKEEARKKIWDGESF